MKIRIALLVTVLLLAGCKPGAPTGPATTKTNSAAFATLAERTKFLNGYVTFRRNYETLDFDITYQNNGGGMTPAPSDWDIRLVATVPAAEVQGWVPASAGTATAPDTTWLKSVPTTINLSGVSEWYVDGERTVGLDRSNRIVVYRLSTN
jgi:hypothetical protein